MLSRGEWGGLRKTMRRWHCGGEMKGEERGELLNSGDQDIAGWKLNFVTNLKIIEGEIKEGSKHQAGQLEWDHRPSPGANLFVYKERRALKLSQIRPGSAALPSPLSSFLLSSVLFYLGRTILAIIKSHFKAWKFLVSQQKSAKKIANDHWKSLEQNRSDGKQIISFRTLSLHWART